MSVECYELFNDEIYECIPVLQILRPQYTREELYAKVVMLTQQCGYRVCCLKSGSIKSVLGYRIGDWLHTGRYLEIEDFVTDVESRSKGYGGTLFDYILTIAKKENCNQIRLVSGVSRKEAHEFYQKRKKMKFEAHYFSINVD